MTKATKKDYAQVSRFFAQDGRSDPLVAMQDIVKHLVGGDVPPTVTQCRKALLKHHIHVNIFEYVAFRQGLKKKKDIICRSVAQLRRRCEQCGFYSLQKAKTNGLKLLLRNLYGN